MPATLRRRAALCLLAAQPLCLPFAAQAAPESVTLEEISVAGEGGGNGAGGAPSSDKKFGVAAPPGAAALPIEQPVGQIVTAVGREAIANRPATSVGSVLLDSPGVTVRQGNGGRDVVISIRGNNARSTGVTRNMVVLEDGFPVTQADGASRFDLVDPRAYSRIDVFRGPQSALFGNYATGGALAFRTRTGREIDGYEIGTDVGSYGYLSNYFTVGGASGPFEISLFASDVRGNGYQQHASYDTQTVNLLASYTPTPDTRFTLKVINNEIDANIPGRSSLNDFYLNPYQRRCDTADSAALGCAKFTLGGIPATAAQAGFRRNDRRTIVAGRFEHDIDAQTTWRVQVGFDERNYNQPFFTSAGRGSLPSYNVLTDLTRRGEFLGLPAVGYVALSYSAVDVTASTYNLTALGGARLGSLVALQDAVQSNLGGRARLEVELSPEWKAVTGISAENTTITGRNRSFSTDPTTGALVTTPAFADRRFLNVAPELALVYQPDPTWALRGRVATGYATPSYSALFITSTGDPGNNTGLKTQENLGFDLGGDWLPVEGLKLSLTGFYEFFRNEFVSQSPGNGRSNYTFNAPASEHRGIELAATYAFAPGWNGVLAYTFDDQVYTDYVELLSVVKTDGVRSNAQLNRAGNRIPGVPDHQLLARVGYDVPAGPLAGLGGFAEVVAQGGYYADNSNLLKIPGYAIVNLNLHYSALLPDGYAKRIDLYGEVRNVLDTVYVASANPVANSLNRDTGLLNGRGVLASTTSVGSIYAGAPRTFVAGMKLSF